MADVIADLAVQLSINDVDDSAITNLQSSIDSMSDKTVSIATDVDTAPITDAESTINSMQDSTIDVATNVDTSALDAAKTTIDDIATSPIDVTTDVDTSALDNVDSEINSLDGQSINVSVNSSGMTQLRTELAAAKAELNGIGPVSKSNLGSIKNDALDATVGTSMLKSGMTDVKKESSSLSKAITSLTGKGSGISKELVAPLKSVGSLAGVAAVQSTMLGSVLGGLGPAAVPAVIGIAAIGTGLVAAGLFSGTFRNTLSQIVPIVQTLGGHLSDAFSDLTKGNITGAVNDIKTGFIGAYDSLKAMDWGGILSKIGTETLAGIKSAVTEAISFLSAVDWGAIGTSIVNGLKTIGTGLQGIFTDAYNYLKAVDWGSVWTAIVSGASKIGDALKTAWDEGIAYLKSVDWGGIWTSIVAGATVIGTGISNIIQHINWDAIWKSIVSGATQIGSGIADAIKSVDWPGVWNYIVSGATTIWNKLGEGLGLVINSIGGWFDKVDWHSVGVQAGTLFGQALVAGIQMSFNILQIIANALGGGGGGGGGNAAAQTAGKGLGQSLMDGMNAGMAGFGAGLQAQISRVHINWDFLLVGLGDMASLMGMDIYNGIAQGLSNALHIPMPTLDTTAARAKVLSDFSNVDALVHVDPDPTSIIGLKGAVLTAAHGPSPAFVTLANGSEVKLTVASAAVGPHMANVYVVNPNGTIRAPVAMNANGPFPANAFVVDPNGTIHNPISTSAVGPHQAQVYVSNPDGSVRAPISLAAAGPFLANINANTSSLVPAIQAAIASGEYDVSVNATGRVTSLVDAKGNKVYAAAEGAIVSAANGGIVSAAGGYGVIHGPQLVMAGDNPGHNEAFVPLKGGKIPVEGNTGGNHTHYHINLSGLITQPIDEDQIVKLIKKAEAMQGAQYG
jgi:Flp pilus assembly pilin Flp